jgi:hypothetical protein
MQDLIDQLESAWDCDGFLGRLREGAFAQQDAIAFLSLLRSIDLEDDDRIPKRFLALIWSLPTFLQWQRERIEERGGDLAAYDRFITEVHNVLEDVLGAP